MRTTMQFSDPSDVQVSITLTGTLKEFEQLRERVSGGGPAYDLTRQIDEAARQLRAKVTVDKDDIALADAQRQLVQG